MVLFLKLWRRTYSHAHKPCWTVGKHSRRHTCSISRLAHTHTHTHKKNAHRNSSSSSCISLWVSAHLLDWLSTVKLAADSKCFHCSPHCELLYMEAAVQGKGHIHLCSFFISLCHSLSLMQTLSVSLWFSFHLLPVWGALVSKLNQLYPEQLKYVRPFEINALPRYLQGRRQVEATKPHLTIYHLPPRHPL